MAGTGARWLLVTPARASAPLRNALAGAGAQRVASEGAAELWRLPAGKPTP